MLYDKEGWSNNTEGSFKEDLLGLWQGRYEEFAIATTGINGERNHRGNQLTYVHVAIKTGTCAQMCVHATYFQVIIFKNY